MVMSRSRCLGAGVAGFVARWGLLVVLSSCNARDAIRVPVDSSETSPEAPPVWPDDATRLVAEDHGGGLIPPPPTGSLCPYPGAGTYTLTVADKMLSSHVCRQGATDASSAYEFVDEARVLADGELAMLTTELKMLTTTSRSLCGADKQVLTLLVTSPTGDHPYFDGFYACQRQGVYVEGIDAVFQTLISLTR